MLQINLFTQLTILNISQLQFLHPINDSLLNASIVTKWLTLSNHHMLYLDHEHTLNMLPEATGKLRF